MKFSEFFFIKLLIILLQEGIEQDSQEKVEENKVTNEDPSNVDSTGHELVHIVVSQGHVQHCLPILHSEYLENGDESNWKAVKVVRRSSLWVINEDTSECLHSQKGEDENEQEHKSSDVNERAVRSSHHTDNSLHGFEGSQKSDNSEHSESSEHSNCLEAGQVLGSSHQEWLQ